MIKLTNKVKFELKKVSKKLPPIETGEKVHLYESCASVKKSNPEAKMQNGENIPSSGFVGGFIKKYVNHYKELEKLYLNGGTIACQKYVDDTFDKFKKNNGLITA